MVGIGIGVGLNHVQGSGEGATPLPSLSLLISPTSVAETGGPVTGTVSRPVDQTTGVLTVTLSSSDTSEATVPATVDIPNGQQSANFNITILNENLADGDQVATISASAVDYTGAQATVTVTDVGVFTGPPSPAVSVLPAARAAGGRTIMYDPSDLTSMYVSRAGTGANPTVGDPVGVFLDVSQLGGLTAAAYIAANSVTDPLTEIPGEHLVVPTSDPKRPTLQQSPGGSYYIDFDGLDDYFSAGNTALSLRSTNVFIAAQEENSSGNNGLVTFSPAGGNDWQSNSGYTINTGNTSGIFGMTAGVSFPTAQVGGSGDMPLRVYEARMNSTAGFEVSDGYTTGAAAGTVSGNHTGPLLIGTRNTLSNYFSGKLFGIVISSGYYLSDTERAVVRDYLQDKVSAAFPASNPNSDFSAGETGYVVDGNMAGFSGSGSISAAGGELTVVGEAGTAIWLITEDAIAVEPGVDYNISFSIEQAAGSFAMVGWWDTDDTVSTLPIQLEQVGSGPFPQANTYRITPTSNLIRIGGQINTGATLRLSELKIEAA